jgi:prepilin-type processing-associated H-X9-DG protein
MFAIINQYDDSGNECHSGGYPDNPSDSYLYFGWLLDQCDGPENEQEAQNPMLFLDLRDDLGVTDKVGLPVVPVQLAAALVYLAEVKYAVFPFPGMGNLPPMCAQFGNDPNLTREFYDEVYDSDINLSGMGLPFETAGNGGSGSSIARLREGVERFMITDINNPAAGNAAQSTMATMFDVINLDDKSGAAFNHIPGGCNVLYMDGHVGWQKYEETGAFPTNGAMAAMVNAIS